MLGEVTEESRMPFQATQRAQRRRDANNIRAYANGTDVTSHAALDHLDQLAGQDSVVAEVRARLAGITAGADGGESAHVFFFYGFPGTGKSFLAELIAGNRDASCVF